MAEHDYTTGLLLLLGEYLEIDPNGCWLWKRTTGSNRYGRILVVPSPYVWIEVVPGVWLGEKWYGGERAKYVTAHRYVAEVKYGPIPDGMVVRHTCDNPPCCNPHHLLLGTYKDNTRDMMERGRARFWGRPYDPNKPRPEKKKAARPILLRPGPAKD